MEHAIIKYIEKSKESVPTLEIAKYVCGKDGTCKMVNPVLYQLLKDGKIVKHSDANGAHPSWSINMTNIHITLKPHQKSYYNALVNEGNYEEAKQHLELCLKINKSE